MLSISDIFKDRYHVLCLVRSVSSVTKTTSPCCSYTVRASLVSGCVCWLAAMMVCLLPTTIAREPQYGWDQQYGEYV